MRSCKSLNINLSVGSALHMSVKQNLCSAHTVILIFVPCFHHVPPAVQPVYKLLTIIDCLILLVTSVCRLDSLCLELEPLNVTISLQEQKQLYNFPCSLHFFLDHA